MWYDCQWDNSLQDTKWYRNNQVWLHRSSTMRKVHIALSFIKDPKRTNVKKLKREKTSDIIYVQNNERNQLLNTATNGNHWITGWWLGIARKECCEYQCVFIAINNVLFERYFSVLFYILGYLSHLEYIFFFQ